MLSNPKVGQRVQVWYGRRSRALMPLHGRTGTLIISSRGRPRNHGVLIDGSLYVVPAGNLRIKSQGGDDADLDIT